MILAPGRYLLHHVVFNYLIVTIVRVIVHSIVAILRRSFNYSVRSTYEYVHVVMSGYAKYRETASGLNGGIAG